MLSRLVDGEEKVLALRKAIWQLDRMGMCIWTVYCLVLCSTYIHVHSATTSSVNLMHNQARRFEGSQQGSCDTDFKTYIKAYVSELGEVLYLNGSDWISSSMFWSFGGFFVATFMSETGMLITTVQHVGTVVVNHSTIDHYLQHQNMSIHLQSIEPTRSTPQLPLERYDSGVMLLLFCTREMGYKHLAVDCVEELVEGWRGN
jgi:hypothetical protein